MNIGTRIRELRQKRGMTITELAEAIDSDAGNVSRMETGKQKSFTELALKKVADALSVSVSDLFNSDELDNTVYKHSNLLSNNARGKDVYRVDILDVAASAGTGGNPSDVIEIVNSIEYDVDYAKAIFGGRPEGSVTLINVRGDSMEGTINPNDLIFVDNKINNFDGDGIYVFDFNGDFFVKRLQKIKFELRVISDNKAYEPWSITPDEVSMLHIEGKVIASQPQQIRRHG
ncbi:XRE family transcriptional regulator [Serratia plymuthica]|uniref:XRE family transcriptional regulator n=1 Tax=Serratia plymuthica TaxID=82996 RepID=UPI0014197972|nr:helix-turn-helix transcriptional regulator [Serratia plymuthica]NIC29325.1 helix-turn-helix transcriptional regulator [Serratia plymuthica]